jgi:hypothetical protein
LSWNSLNYFCSFCTSSSFSSYRSVFALICGDILRGIVYIFHGVPALVAYGMIGNSGGILVIISGWILLILGILNWTGIIAKE